MLSCKSLTLKAAKLPAKIVPRHFLKPCGQFYCNISRSSRLYATRSASASNSALKTASSSVYPGTHANTRMRTLGSSNAAQRSLATITTSSLKGRINSETNYPLVQHPSFEVLGHDDVSELNITFTTYRHKLTGAEIISIQSSEEEKVFGIAFPTPVDDDTGVAHILEHSVLCGSRKYPLKEPFVHLLKSSLKTYLNAMTYPDRTVYPVASPNTQDFYNLVNVYCDAVFNPLLEPWVLQQEGWHYELVADEGKDPKLQYKGVVFNEMKGVYSSTDAIRMYEAEAALFPDNNYAKSSGGDPLMIPTLTYEAFLAFHRKYYHPSNAKVYWFGDDPVDVRLNITDEYLSKAYTDRPTPQLSVIYPDIGPNTVRLQPLFSQPKRLNRPYPCATGAESEEVDVEEDLPEAEADAPSLTTSDVHPPSATTAVYGSLSAALTKQVDGAFEHCETPPDIPDRHELLVSWVLNSHPKELSDLNRLALGLLSHLLVSTQVAILYKALTDSALGSAVIGDGYDDTLIQATFSVGLKGIKGADVANVEALILDTLVKAAETGFSQEHVEASLHTLEFGAREFASGGSPRGLSLFLGCIPSWIYGRDVTEDIRFERVFKELRQTLASDPTYLQTLLKKYVINNGHRVTLHMYPDPTPHRTLQETQLLAAREATLTPADRESITNTQEALLQRQATPDPPEAVATIPTLRVEDLPKDSKKIQREVKQLFSSGAGPLGKLLCHEQPTNGITYASLSFEMSDLPQAYLPYLPLFSWALTSCGTKQRSEEEMSHLLGANTGGVFAKPSMIELPGRASAVLPLFTIGGKALAPKADRLGVYMHELLTSARFDRRDRVEHYLRSVIAKHESALVSAGQRYAASLLGAQFSKSGWLSEVFGGLTQFYAAKAILKELQQGGPAAFDELVARLEDMRSILLQRKNAFATVTGDSAALPAGEACLRCVVDGIPGDTNGSTGVSKLARDWLWPLHHHNAQQHHGKVPHWPFSSLFGQDIGTHGLVPQYIGIVVPSQVNYVVKAGRGIVLNEAHRFVPGSFEVASSVLNTSYMWDKVRVQGGAYGGSMGVGRSSGVVSFGSYRDPNLGATIQVYDGAAAWLKQHAKSSGVREEIKNAILSTIGSIDAPMSPAEKGEVDTLRYLAGITEEDVNTRRHEILNTSSKDLEALADALDVVSKEGRVVAVGSEAAFNDYHSKDKRGPLFELTRPLEQDKKRR